MKYIYLLLFSLFAFFGYSQTQDCPVILQHSSTPNKEELRQMINQSVNTVSPRDIITLPLWVHSIKAASNSNSITLAQAEEALETVNQHYAGTNLQFEICNFSSILNAEYDHLNEISEGDELAAAFNRSNVINVYLVDHAAGFCGWGMFPWYDRDYILLDNQCVNDGSSFAHELGHYLGLWHTHTTYFAEELVNRTNCDVAGDLFCDTAADPGLSGRVDQDCFYTGTLTDDEGNAYMPDPTNIMSYSRKHCKTFFSDQQIEMVNYIAQTERDYLFCNDDSYLPDLFIKNARTEVPVTELNGAVKVDCRTRYSGNGSSNISTKVYYYISTDAELSMDDLLVGENTSQLSALRTFNAESILIDIPETIQEGDYFILIVIDPLNAIKETREDNNIVALPISIGNQMYVEYDDLDKTVKDCELTLTWKVKHEIFLERYELEFSFDDEHFSTIAIFDSKKDEDVYQDVLEYQYKGKFIAETNYFRIKMVSRDSSVLYTPSFFVGMPRACLFLDLNVYPNPLILREQQELYVSNINDWTGVEIFDIYGRKYVVQQEQIINIGGDNMTLNLSFLPTGTYFLRHKDVPKRSITFVVIE